MISGLEDAVDDAKLDKAKEVSKDQDGQSDYGEETDKKEK